MSDHAFETARLERLLDGLARLAGGDHAHRLEITERRDHLDALAYGVNGMAQELVYLKDMAERANQAKSQFLAVMSHEIRTPLSAVLGLCELLRDPRMPEGERIALVERIRANGRLLLAVVDNVLDISKIEAGKMGVECARMSAAEAVEEVVLGLGQWARDKGLAIRVSAEPGAPAQILADPARVRQILTNLVGNSIKFTSSGHVAIELRRGRRPARDVLEIVVSDTGLGIEPDKQSALFQAFEQADPSVARLYGGSGLGLVLGRRLANLMEGELELAQSVRGEGSTFVLSLPVHGTESRWEAVAPSPPPSDAGCLSGVRILIAEDCEELQYLYRAFLEREGASVEMVGDGEAAVSLAQSGAFDVLLMDVNMPRLSGVQAAKRLRDGGSKLPIVALTAHARSFHEEGFDGSLSKPFYPEKLTETVMRALHH